MHDYKLLTWFADRIAGTTNSRICRETAIRWATRGVRGTNGQRVVLEAVRIGSRWFTTEEWFNTFMAELSTKRAATLPTTAPIRSPAQTKKATAKAKRALKQAGV